MILMSPPCQPFTRVGLKRDMSDNRTSSFIHLLSLLPHLNKKWKYLVVENVKGFEKSETCQQLIHTLENLDFCYQEFILSPSMFSIPNTRHRYYLIAKRRPLYFNFPLQPHVMESLPVPLHTTSSFTDAAYEMSALNSKHKCLVEENQMASEGTCYSLNHILEINKSLEYFEQFNVPDKILGKHAWLLDIVGPNSTRSCCFTKAYGRYVEGTGSVFSPTSPDIITNAFEQSRSHVPGSHEQLELLRGLAMRYFTHREVARLMCFPDQGFSLPNDVTIKQSYCLLGNSVNVHVVALLILLLTTGDNTVC
ncbi:tRNA (cytosine-5-)-methyltransferase isoform X2 [Zootermopsis nevadensis]|nr:tRNA (cytosine-5-)-methyltransferase isoform X2 [Zootermopsis nevadensis]